MIIKPNFYPWAYSIQEYRECPIRLWLTVKNIPCNIQMILEWCWEIIDRGLHGYTNSDVWNLDYYLARIMVGTVSHLRESKGGYPCHCSPNSNKPCECNKEWDKTLTEIIEGFQIVLDWEKLPLFPAVGSKERKKLSRALSLFHKYFLNLWD